MSTRDDIFRDVYDSMLGMLYEEYLLPWVPNINYPGSPYDKAYGEMLEASWRICERLGKDGEDEDVECMRDAYEEMQDLLCRQMFACGAAYAMMKQNSSPVD